MLVGFGTCTILYMSQFFCHLLLPTERVNALNWKGKCSFSNTEFGCTNAWLWSQSFFLYTGVLQLMEIGDVQRKDIMDHPENYTLLTTLDEGLFLRVKSWFILMSPFSFSGKVLMLTQVCSSETWRKFKEEGENLGEAPQTTICEDGIKEMVTFLNPKQIEDLCSP